MSAKNIKVISRFLCVVMLAAMILEAPLTVRAQSSVAATSVQTIKVNVGQQSFNVTPGQWITYQGASYNVRFVNGRAVALSVHQYMEVVLGDGGAAAAAAAGASSGSSQSGSANSSSGSASSSGSSGSSNPSSSAANSAQSGSGNQAGGAAATGGAADPTQSQSGTAQTGVVAPNNQAGTVPSSVTTNGVQVSYTYRDPSTGRYISASDAAAKGISPTGVTYRDVDTNRYITREQALQKGAPIDPSHVDPAQVSQSQQTADPGQMPQGGDAAQGGDVAQGGDAAQGGDVAQGGDAAQGGDVAQGGDAAQGGDVAQGGDAAQTGQAGEAGQVDQSGNLSFKDKVSAKFQSGYEAGKAMTNAGVQNVKDSLKSGFSAKNLLVTAGITVAVDLANQIVRGEKPSVKKALKTVLCAEFAGGVAGSVVGAAAGSFFVPFLSAVPVVGGLLGALAPTFGSIVGGSVGSYLAGDLKNGRFSIKEAFKRIDWVGVAGQTIGSTAGAAIGSAICPGIGTIIGGIVGGMVGNWAAHKIADLFGGKKGTGDTATTGTPAMPTGTNPYGSYTGGSVTIGSGDANDIPGITPVSDTNAAASVTIPSQPGSYASEVQLAYARYQELYSLWCNLTAQGLQDEALKVAVEVNKAKKAYDDLRAQENK